MRTLMLVAGFPMLLAGCAGSTSGSVDQLGETRDRIIETFKSEAGIGFIRSSVPKEIREFGNLPRFERLEPKLSKLQAKRYGYFMIWVYEDRQARDRDMSQPGTCPNPAFLTLMGSTDTTTHPSAARQQGRPTGARRNGTARTYFSAGTFLAANGSYPSSGRRLTRCCESPLARRPQVAVSPIT
jgi:hypothetical protein